MWQNRAQVLAFGGGSRWKESLLVPRLVRTGSPRSRGCLSRSCLRWSPRRVSRTPPGRSSSPARCSRATGFRPTSGVGRGFSPGAPTITSSLGATATMARTSGKRPSARRANCRCAWRTTSSPGGTTSFASTLRIRSRPRCDGCASSSPRRTPAWPRPQPPRQAPSRSRGRRWRGANGRPIPAGTGWRPGVPTNTACAGATGRILPAGAISRSASRICC